MLALNIEPLPSGSKELKGYPGFYRVDSDEYRIVYRFDANEDLRVSRSPLEQVTMGLVTLC
ncbi:MAG: hypothetical protein JOZ78_14295 [Chroococcidiopsidaceae cyanobacterium CP_BM_ER_R8_30]|nr:hypothetical protein [Chroococcidiopsidaceae cyanobacterium CP_BM_ER_R8_30]